MSRLKNEQEISLKILNIFYIFQENSYNDEIFKDIWESCESEIMKICSEILSMNSGTICTCSFCSLEEPRGIEKVYRAHGRMRV